MPKQCFKILIFKFLFLISFSSIVFSQKKIELHRQFTSPTPSLVFAPKIIVKDSLTAWDSIFQTIKKLQKQAFFLAKTDSVIQKNDSVLVAYFHPDKQFKWATIKGIDFPPKFWATIEPDILKIRNRPLNADQLQQVQETVLQKAENNGFPFASVQLQPLQWKNESLEAQLILRLGKQIIVDSFHIEGKTPVSIHFLQKYLGISNGSVYDKSKILKISKRLKELPFLKETKPSVQIFQGKGVCIHLFLEAQNASRFDGVLGLLPKSTDLTQSGSSKLTITGTLLADLYNLLDKGERFTLDFQQLRPETQQLKTRGIYPYLFKTNFGVDVKLDIYKQDSTFLEVNREVGIQYITEGNNYAKVFWNRISSNLLTVDIQSIKNSKKLPDKLDYSTDQFGIEWVFQKTDYRHNPQKGFVIALKSGAGVKKVKRNQNILNLSDATFSPEKLYDSIAPNAQQFRFEAKVEHYWKLSKLFTFKSAVQSGGIFSEKAILNNESYRLGGSRSLRGFDEGSIFADKYALFTTEIRLITGRNSFIHAFSDFALTNTQSSVQPNRKWLGVGVGMTLETAVGIVGISAAIGKQDSNPFDFRSTKIHFGYVSLF